MPWPETGETKYHTQFGLPDKGRAIKGLVSCNNQDLGPLDLLYGLALDCYQPFLGVLIVSINDRQTNNTKFRQASHKQTRKTLLDPLNIILGKTFRLKQLSKYNCHIQILIINILISQKVYQRQRVKHNDCRVNSNRKSKSLHNNLFGNCWNQIKYISM